MFWTSEFENCQRSLIAYGISIKIPFEGQLARRKFAFPVHIVEPWNKLPLAVVDSASEEIFKRCLDGVWDTLFVP